MTPKANAPNNAGLQDDHDPNDLGQRLANKPNAEKSQREGPAAYAPLPDEQSSADEAREKRDKEGQGIVRDERGQEQPADKKRAQRSGNTGAAD